MFHTTSARFTQQEKGMQAHQGHVSPSKSSVCKHNTSKPHTARAGCARAAFTSAMRDHALMERLFRMHQNHTFVRLTQVVQPCVTFYVQIQQRMPAL